MNVKNETLPHAGGYIRTELGTYSREIVTINLGQKLQAGAVLGKLTGSDAGQYAAYDNGASDGSEQAAGILYDDVDATDADVKGVAHVRGPMEVHNGRLVFATGQDQAAQDAAIVDLAALDIIARS
jgi:tRNA U55 pseudouridine synthase TruB